MEKYNKILKNLAELVEKGLFSSKDLKKEIESSLKFIVENIVNKLNLVSRDEFEVQKKIIEKMRKSMPNNRVKRKTTKAKKS
jgi:BMFP domain-containing protein YqiC